MGCRFSIFKQCHIKTGFGEGDGAGSIKILEFKNRLLIAEKNKKNSQLHFASWPLRSRTDEEIIRLCIRLLMNCCKVFAKTRSKVKKLPD